jgi:hypothetical protein
LNRDPKRTRKAYTAEDFCFFVDHGYNKPEERAARAFMSLVQAKQLPSFALGFFSDFKHGKASKAPWEEQALVHESFILLAPMPIDGGFTGTMLAENEVAGQVIEVQHMGQTWVIQVPDFNDYVKAENSIEIDVVRPPEPVPPGS